MQSNLKSSYIFGFAVFMAYLLPVNPIVLGFDGRVVSSVRSDADSGTGPVAVESVEIHGRVDASDEASFGSSSDSATSALVVSWEQVEEESIWKESLGRYETERAQAMCWLGAGSSSRPGSLEECAGLLGAMSGPSGVRVIYDRGRGEVYEFAESGAVSHSSLCVDSATVGLSYYSIRQGYAEGVSVERNHLGNLGRGASV